MHKFKAFSGYVSSCIITDGATGLYNLLHVLN